MNYINIIAINIVIKKFAFISNILYPLLNWNLFSFRNICFIPFTIYVVLPATTACMNSST